MIQEQWPCSYRPRCSNSYLPGAWGIATPHKLKPGHHTDTLIDPAPITSDQEFMCIASKKPTTSFMC